MWSKLAKYVSRFVEQVGLKWLVSTILGYLGMASTGFVGWIVMIAAKFGWGKAKQKIVVEAYHADRVSSDEEANETYQEKIKENASEEELIKSELDILNPKRRH